MEQRFRLRVVLLLNLQASQLHIRRDESLVYFDGLRIEASSLGPIARSRRDHTQILVGSCILRVDLNRFLEPLCGLASISFVECLDGLLHLLPGFRGYLHFRHRDGRRFIVLRRHCSLSHIEVLGLIVLAAHNKELRFGGLDTPAGNSYPVSHSTRYLELSSPIGVSSCGTNERSRSVKKLHLNISGILAIICHSHVYSQVAHAACPLLRPERERQQRRQNQNG